MRRYDTMGSVVARQGTGAGDITVHLLRNGKFVDGNGLWDEMRVAGFDFGMIYSA